MRPKWWFMALFVGIMVVNVNLTYSETQEAPWEIDEHTLLLAHYDGNTGNGGLDADFAKGSPVASFAKAHIVENGKIGKMLNLTSQFDWVSYESKNNIDASKGTIEMWIKPVGHLLMGYNWQIFDGYTDDSNRFLWYFNAVDGTRFQFISGGRTIAVATAKPDSLKWEKNNWYHIAGTWDAKAGKMEFFRDGVLVACEGNPKTWEPITIDKLWFGVNRWGGESSNGCDFPRIYVDELRISDTIRYSQK